MIGLMILGLVSVVIGIFFNTEFGKKVYDELCDLLVFWFD